MGSKFKGKKLQFPVRFYYYFEGRQKKNGRVDSPERVSIHLKPNLSVGHHIYQLTLLHSKGPKLYTILALLSAIALKSFLI